MGLAFCFLITIARYLVILSKSSKFILTLREQVIKKQKLTHLSWIDNLNHTGLFDCELVEFLFFW